MQSITGKKQTSEGENFSKKKKKYVKYEEGRKQDAGYGKGREKERRKDGELNWSKQSTKSFIKRIDLFSLQYRTHVPFPIA